MSTTLGGKSILTSDTTLLIYYALSMLSLVVGVTFFVALVGVFFSRYAANKEGAVFVEQHCIWLFRSLWISFVLICLIVVATIFLLGATGIVIPDTSQIDSLAQLWVDPAIRLALQYIFVMLACVLLVLLWFLYRIIRGGLALINRQPLRELKIHTRL